MISHRPTFGDMLANVPAPRFDRTAPARIVQPLDNSRVYPMVDRAPNFRAWFVAILVSVAAWVVAIFLIRWWLS